MNSDDQRKQWEIGVRHRYFPSDMDSKSTYHQYMTSVAVLKEFRNQNPSLSRLKQIHPTASPLPYNLDSSGDDEILEIDDYLLHLTHVYYERIFVDGIANPAPEDVLKL